MKTSVATLLRAGAALLGAADLLWVSNLNTANNPPALDETGVLPAVVGHRQGTAAALNAVVLADGEIAVTVDGDGKPIGLRIGNGEIPGGWILPLGSSGDGPPAAISGDGRYVFYGGSSFAASGNDNAIDTSKAALVPGVLATFANYTSYDRGINGVMVDLENTGDALAINADDFEFRVGNTSDPTEWDLLETAPTVNVRRGEGDGGSDRIELTWPDNTIQNQWLQVTVKATANTGLESPDVHYWGNQIGEAGDTPGSTVVNNTDLFAVFGNATDDANVNNPYDINKDGVVDNDDVTIVSNNTTSAGESLLLITAPE